jgi:hypothetical protein
MLLLGSMLLLGGLTLATPAAWFGSFIIAGGVVWMISQKSKFSVVLTAAGGEVTAYSSYDRAFIGRVIQAITEAIVARG